MAAQPLKLLGANYLGDLPTLVADKGELFAEHGVTVTVDYGTSGRDNLRALRAGRADFALMALTPLVLDHLHDDAYGEADDPVILAAMVQSRRLNHVVARRDNDIRTADDIAGRRVGVVEGTNTAFAWSLYADYHGRSAGYARVVDEEPRALAEALIAGDLAAAVLWEPWIRRIEQRIGEPLRRLDHGDLYTTHWVLVTRRRAVADTPGRVQDVLRAYRAAIEAIEADPASALALYAEHTGLEQPANPPGWSTLDYDLSLDWSLVASIQHQVAWARGSGRAATDRETDVLSLFADGPLRRIAPASVGIPASDRRPAQ